RSMPGPSASTSPANSSPGMSCGASAGAGYAPMRWRRSARLIAVALTRTRTSPRDGSGYGRSTSARTLGPPGLVIAMAFMREPSRRRTVDHQKGWRTKTLTWRCWLRRMPSIKTSVVEKPVLLAALLMSLIVLDRLVRVWISWSLLDPVDVRGLAVVGGTGVVGVVPPPVTAARRGRSTGTIGFDMTRVLRGGATDRAARGPRVSLRVGVDRRRPIVSVRVTARRPKVTIAADDGGSWRWRWRSPGARLAVDHEALLDGRGDGTPVVVEGWAV